MAKKTKDPQLAGILKACQPSDISSDYKSASQLVDRFSIPLCIFRLFLGQVGFYLTCQHT